MIARWRSLLQAESAQRHTASQQSVIERAERDVHVAEHSDDFVDQFHDGFLFWIWLCDEHHRKGVYASLLNRSTFL